MVYYGRGFSDFFVPISSLPKEWETHSFVMSRQTRGGHGAQEGAAHDAE